MAGMRLSIMSSVKPEISPDANSRERENLDTSQIGLESHTENRIPSASHEADQLAISVFEKYHRVLHKFLYRRLSSLEDVKEMAQEVYLRVIRYGRHTEVKHPRAFLFKTARNLLKDDARRKAARFSDRHVTVDETELTCPYPTPDDIMQSKQVMEKITEVLEALKPHARRAFVLHRFKGLTYAEIASEMGVSKSMVNHHISAVLEKMNESLRGIK